MLNFRVFKNLLNNSQIKTFAGSINLAQTAHRMQESEGGTFTTREKPFTYQW